MSKQLKFKKMKKVVFLTTDMKGKKRRLSGTLRQVINIYGDIDNPKIDCYGIGADIRLAKIDYNINLKQKADSWNQIGEPFSEELLKAS